MKVLHVAETAQGGVGSYIEEILDIQSKQYGPLAVKAVLPDAHARHFKRIPRQGLEAFAVNPSGRIGHSIAMTRLTWRLVREWQPDVVHLHSSFAGLFVRPALALLPRRPKIIYCAHGWAFDRSVGKWANRLSAGIERVLSRWSDAIVCVSAMDRETAIRAGIAAQRLIVIPNGIRDLASPADATLAGARWPAGKRRILFVGRLDRQKGIDILSDVMRALGDEAHAVIVGAAVVGGEVTDLPVNCEVTGWLPREEIATLYAAADLLVMPSRWEGLPIVAIEALRAGLPVVSSAVGGLPEVVEPGVNGQLVPSNTAEDFICAIQSLKPAELSDMKVQARRLYEERFQIERVIERLDVLYRSEPGASQRP